MAHLYEVLATRVDRWRADGYPTSDHAAIGEILEWATDPESGTSRFLRRPQLRALETYWYLRLVEGTPHVLDLYRRLFPQPPDLLAALGLTAPELTRQFIGTSLDVILDRVRTDDALVRRFHLESVRETLTLDYPSYILALAMGAGKTILIGAIFATEFAMALEYPDGPFVQNALVFAPGKTIIESLRELATVPYERILPPRLHKGFAASVKLTFTRDGERDIPVVRGSLYNVVVTNTEKIRIQKETVRKGDLGGLFAPKAEDQARAEVANLRLQAIASLPHLGIFSDEAHHTYGQSLATELKKVRRTVDYLAASTKVVSVVNTTGTPYFQRQPLRDVVIWYGLSQGIKENILKDVSGNIQAFDFGDDASAYVRHVVEDFFRDYGGVRLPNGAPARLALYFPQNDDLDALRPAVESALVTVGESPAVCLRNTSESTKDEVDAFNRLNDPAAPHRVILLVNKGTEGWNCPSLFASALARRLRSSNNFVLQAATRCLRQVPGNATKARIYLSRDNRTILDRQLQETYGESIAELQQATRERGAARLVLKKRSRPPLVLTRLVRTVVPASRPEAPLRLGSPATGAATSLEKAVLELVPAAGLRRVLQQVGDTIRIETVPAVVDRYEAAVTLASVARVDLWTLLDELERLYPGSQDVPVGHLDDLARQLADHTRAYEVREERVEWALALVRPDGFDRGNGPAGEELYTAEITYPKDREKLLLRAETLREQNPRGFGFHYDPYNFDSSPEAECFRLLLQELNLRPEEIEDIYFTGGLTDPAKTDFRVEYVGEDGRVHGYTPDFVVRKRPLKGGHPGSGRVLVVEVKDARWETPVREDEARWARGEIPLTTEGRKAVTLRRLEKLDPDRLRYEMVFAREVPGADQMSEAYRFIREPESAYETDRQVAERLKERVLQSQGDRVRRIILFGSRARGDARPDSDYDLLVVMDDLTDAEHKERLLSLYRAFEGVGVVAEPWIMSETYFEETKEVIGGLAYPANKEGVLLYERP